MPIATKLLLRVFTTHTHTHCYMQDLKNSPASSKLHVVGLAVRLVPYSLCWKSVHCMPSPAPEFKASKGSTRRCPSPPGPRVSSGAKSLQVHLLLCHCHEPSLFTYLEPCLWHVFLATWAIRAPHKCTSCTSITGVSLPKNYSQHPQHHWAIL